MLRKNGAVSPMTENKDFNIERSKKAAQERWNPTIPKATHSGILQIGGIDLECDVLQDGRRILRRKTFLKAMGRGKIGGKDRGGEVATNLPIFLKANNLTPYLKPEIIERGAPIKYRGHNGGLLTGYDANILPAVCKIYAQADDANGLQENQKKIANVCRVMLYGLAEVGITALIDDATGYVYERERNELQIILEKYIAKELMPWTKRFPDEFFEQVYRLHVWQWPKINKNHPQCVGTFINKYIYDALPEGILDELRTKNPPNENGNRIRRHHQWLTESMGDKTLEKQVAKVVTLMKVSNDMNQFKELIEKC